MKKLGLLCLIFVLASCGGGGSDPSACSALKVTGGESCDGGLPNVAYLEVVKGGMLYTCTGTYISQTAVLTAKHCVTGQPSSVDVYAPGHVTSGVQWILHRTMDLAIIKVASPMQATPAPVLLFGPFPANGETVVAYGYGIDQAGEGAGERISNGEAPLKATSLSFSGAVPGNWYVTTSNGSGNVCKGDSGGPIVARDAAGRYGLVGVTSYSPSVSDEHPCVPINEGSEVYDVSLQNADAADFIATNVPDVAVE